MLIKKITLLLLAGVQSISANSNLITSLTEIVNQVEEKKHKHKKVLNYAFKQRMRIELIARDAILLSMNLNNDLYRKEILKNANLFNINFTKLMESKEEIDTAERIDKGFKEELNKLKVTWLEFYKNIQSISDKKKNKEALNFIEENNMALLNDIDYVFTTFIKAYQSRDKLEASMNHFQTVLYSQVGKPRMYINKLVKERLFMHTNIHIQENKKTLDESIKKMDKLMKGLKDGDKELELNGTEDVEIVKQLLVAQNIWEEIKKMVIVNRKLTEKEIEELVNKNNKFITEHTKVVELTRKLNDM
jgi:hypothetical protein